MSLLRHLHALNRVTDEALVPWQIDGQVQGWLQPALAADCRASPELFTWHDGVLALRPAADFAARSALLAAQVARWAARDDMPQPMGEPYPVTPGARAAAVAVVDRAYAPVFGIRTFGQHLNGYVRREDGLWMWLGRRAFDRVHAPGRLDQLVAGGLPHGLSLRDNLAKECAEEAGMPAALAARAHAVGALTYNRSSERGFRADVLYCYDLEVPEDFTPVNSDGEVAEFILLPVEKVLEIVEDTDEFKLNCNLVVIDFLLRHGVLDPDRPDYLDLLSGLRPPLGPHRP